MTRTKDPIHELEAKLARLSGEERRSREGIDVINWGGWMLVSVDLERAVALFAEACEHAEAIDYPLGIARARFGAAFRDFFTADYAEALRTLHAQAPTLRELGNAMDRANVLLLEGLIHWSLGDFELATDLLQGCYDASKPHGYRYGEGWSLTSLASIYESLGDFDKAEAGLDEIDLRLQPLEGAA